jgi:hypothetical protein
MIPYNEDEHIESYIQRNKIRETKLFQATIDFVGYFVDLGDDLLTAQNKVSQLSGEVSQYIYVYVLGNTKPLIDAINDSTLPFMDEAAKLKLVGDLSF